MNVPNRSCIRRLSLRSLLANRTRNIVAVLAIALTAVLFTSLFTIALSINEGIQQNNFRQAGGWSHGTFKYLTEEQFEELKDDPLIDQWGLRRFLGMPTQAPFNKSHVEIGYSDANRAHWSYCDPVEGRLPQEGTNESHLVWTAMKRPRPLPCAAGGSTTRPWWQTIFSFPRAGWTPFWQKWA